MRLVDLLSVAEARRKLLEVFSPVGTERVALEHACGRVLACDVRAGFDLPPFANSSMDGFAVRSEDVKQTSLDAPVELRVVADAPAGEALKLKISTGEAVRIMTGATLPAGADSVVPVEDTDFNHRQPGLPAPSVVQIYKPVEPGAYVRPRGQDVQSGELVLTGSLRLRAPEIGFLAMLGAGEVEVYRKPIVAVFSTGDELVPIGQPLLPGKIHDANSYTLSVLIEQSGGKILPLGIIPDHEAAVEAVLEQAIAENVDCILSSAGVSVGAFDFVRSVVETRGNLSFWRVNMRPGKPLAFGDYKGVPFIGLPGNPVSAYIGFEVFVRSALMKMSGLEMSERPTVRVKLEEPIESDGRESYLRARIRNEAGVWLAKLTGHQGSGNLRSLVQANALLIIQSGVKSLPIGAETEAWIMDDFSLSSSTGSG